MTRLCDALAVPRGVTAVVGGGGKTALIAALARELCPDGRVLLATTTHIWPPAGTVLLRPTPDALERAFARGPLVAVGEACPDGKLRAPDTPLRELATLADYTLLEADGSRGLPVKAPNENEPALTGAEALVLAVAGVSALGQSIARAAHRPERVAALLGKPTDAQLAPEDLALLLQSPMGQRKAVTCRYAVVLNQCDHIAAVRAAREIARRLDCDCALCALQARPGWLELWRAGARA